MATTTRVLAPPRAAAVAGVIFSVLMVVSLATVRLAVPDYRTDTGAWLADPSRQNAVRLALQLVPFAGVAFLWFIGVLRNRLGELEDQFFATVFLGSGLLFVASMFASVGVLGVLLETMADRRVSQINGDMFAFLRQVGGTFLNVFAIKMAGVFIFSTSTVMLRTGIVPRWVAFLGFTCGIVLLLIITNWPWIALLFPLWILIVSTCILLSDLRSPKRNLTPQAANE